eukprot:TRINITY_DN1771_c0_g1_i1.p4 TRINITY_DN1771_c0_g1~~TRINITY_DN1771_c0_g1_i1.p4  ORF type:complete len:113 (-),score=10.74 TRINITY_DN1771_c0_g1_i1:241-579(-)
MQNSPRNINVYSHGTLRYVQVLGEMMANIVWMQTGACSGDTMALLCADRPSVENLTQQYQVNFLWHPSLTAERRFGNVLEAVTSGREKLDILCIEGSLMIGPSIIDQLQQAG